MQPEEDLPESLGYPQDSPLYHALGQQEGCHRLAYAFYAHVAHDPILRPLYPPTLKGCPINHLGAFLTQFLGGPCEYGRLSVREAHLRFSIGPKERAAWLKDMFQALDDLHVQEPARSALRWYFLQSSASFMNHSPEDPDTSAFSQQGHSKEQNVPEWSLLHQDIARRWDAHQTLEQLIASVRQGEVDQALLLLQSRPVHDLRRHNRAAYLSLLALLAGSDQPELGEHVSQTLTGNPALAHERYAGDQTLLHAVAGQSNVRMVTLLLHLGADPNASDAYGHTPLYCVSNAYPVSGGLGATVVSLLVQAGAHVNARERVKGCSALHMAARRGNVLVAQALLNRGADVEARDKSGDTPLHRAVKCKQAEMVAFLLASGADVQATDKRGQTPQQVARGERILQVLQTT